MNKEEKRRYVFAQLNSLPNAFQYVEVTGYIDRLEKENKELHNKIDKAIEYIANKKTIINTDVIRIFDLFKIDEQGYTDKLLEILKGEEND